MNEEARNLEELCVAKGMRMTEQRRTIARVLEEATDHPDVEELYRRASAMDPKISIATVYRTVKLFEDAGVIARHDFGAGRARYETIPEEHHDHLIDLRSGRVFEFRDDEIEKSCSRRSPSASASGSSIIGWNSTACRSTRPTSPRQGPKGPKGKTRAEAGDAFHLPPVRHAVSPTAIRRPTPARSARTTASTCAGRGRSG